MVKSNTDIEQSHKQQIQKCNKVIQKHDKTQVKQQNSETFIATEYFQLPSDMDQDVKDYIHKNYGKYVDRNQFTIQEVRQQHVDKMNQFVQINEKIGKNAFSQNITIKNFIIPKNYTKIQTQNYQQVTNEEMKVRGYYLDSKQSNKKCLIFYHGGGFVRGGPLESNDFFCYRMAQEFNTNVLSVDYSLAPEFKYPQAIWDSIIACQYIYDNGNSIFEIDNQQIGVTGHSAGGNIAILVAYYQVILKNSYKLIYNIPLNPVCDWDFQKYESYLQSSPQKTPDLCTDHMIWFRDQYFNNKSDKYEENLKEIEASPVYIPVEILSKMSPSIIIIAEYDALKSEGELYMQNVEKSNTLLFGKIYKGVMHDFYYRFHYKKTDEMFEDISNALKKLQQNQ